MHPLFLPPSPCPTWWPLCPAPQPASWPSASAWIPPRRPRSSGSWRPTNLAWWRATTPGARPAGPGGRLPGCAPEGAGRPAPRPQFSRRPRACPGGPSRDPRPRPDPDRGAEGQGPVHAGQGQDAPRRHEGACPGPVTAPHPGANPQATGARPGSKLVQPPVRVLDLRMRASSLWSAFFERPRPSRWGPIPVFLALAFGLRVLLGEALPPPNPRLIVPGSLFLLGIYLVAPMPWQWDGPRTGAALTAARLPTGPGRQHHLAIRN